MTRAQIGCVHGRFQPFHLGHLEYALAGANRCGLLLIGITNPDPSLTRPEPTDVERGRPQSNPFSFYERYAMVEGAMLEYGVGRERFRIVPFPHSFPELLRHYVPRDALHFVTIYDAWGETKLERFRELGFATEVLWRRTEKLTTGSEVRRRLRSGQSVLGLVPTAVKDVIDAKHATTRNGCP
jgi:nicotinamide mononucleotide adenylyltransferase